MSSQICKEETMRRRLLYLVFGLTLVFFGPAGAALANGSGHEGDHHEGDHHDDGDHHDGGGTCQNGDHHDGDHHDGDHHDGNRSHSSGHKTDSHEGDHHDNEGDDDDEEDDDDGGGSCQSACPCVAVLPLFGMLVNGSAHVADCIDSATVTSVVTTVGTFVITDSGAMPPFCSIGNSPPFISITAADAVVCRALLRQSATSQSVACHPPE
jgi:hypothetical protein